MRRRLLIIIVLLVVGLSIFIVTGYSDLSKAESNTTKKFEKIRPQLETRYEKLFDALTLAEKIGGKRDVTTEGLKAYKNYKKAINAKNTMNELETSIELENIIGRLRTNTTNVKLSGSQELKDAVALIDSSVVSKDVKDAYNIAAKSYEEKRTSWRYLLSATVFGFSANKTLQFSEPSL